MDLKGQKVVVVGLGKSGAAAARLCIRLGAVVTGTDDQSEAKLAPVLASLASLPIQFALSGISRPALAASDLVVLSPGVPASLPALVETKERGVPIISEIELASRFIQAPFVGITGTNGKSTVTSLCGAIAEKTGRPSFCGGNLGTPLSEVVGTEAAGAAGIVVCELSSYQLETIDRLHCRAAAVLNLTPDHLDRYPSLAAYGDAKGQIFRNMSSQDVRVLNADDPEVLALYERSTVKGKPAYCFSTTRKLQREILGGYVDHKTAELVLHLDAESDSGVERFPLSDLQIVGRHNQGNALAAFLLLRASGLATQAQVQEAASGFRALPHRMEKVLTHQGISYFDDSKGTNVDAVVAGLAGFPTPFALIAGGRDKGGSYEPLVEVLRASQVRGVVVIGEAAAAIAQATEPVAKVVHASSMDEAVARATELCKPGDSVILSPACSSFDMFIDYAHRAACFVKAAKNLAGLLDQPSPGVGGHP